MHDTADTSTCPSAVVQERHDDNDDATTTTGQRRQRDDNDDNATLLHDRFLPTKIAICWPFLQGNCPHTAETCPLSHDSNPHRTPLCVHFANAGRCTRANRSYPHVRVGPREGVCRDFAVLGYCETRIDCTKQHVRECPDFAESGEWPNKFCKTTTRQCDDVAM